MNPLQKNIYTLTRNFLILSLFVCIVLIQRTYDKIEHPHILFTTETRYILPASVVKNLSFGFKNSIADLYWVKAIQDFSIWDGRDPFYVKEYENIATLDPKFSYPYLLAILTFTSTAVNNKNADPHILETIEPLIQKGMKNLPDNWEIPFYLGTGFQLTKNTEKALYYLSIASSNKDAPEIIHKVYATHLKNTISGKSASGKDLVKAIYDTTTSETTKKMLEEGIKIDILKETLETISRDFKKKYGVYPSSLNDLTSRKILQVGQDFKNEFDITFNRYTGEVTVKAK